MMPLDAFFGRLGEIEQYRSGCPAPDWAPSDVGLDLPSRRLP